MSRRTQLASILPLIACLITGPAFGQPPREKTSKVGFYFNTPCSISIYGKAPDGDFSEVFGRMAKLDEQLNIHSENSALSTLNKNAGLGPAAVPDSVYEVVRHGIAYSYLSGGSFDVSVGPLVKLWDIAGPNPRVPPQSEIDDTLVNVDYRRVVLLEAEKRVLLEKKGMALDLGGIAKGYAADEAVLILRKQGHAHAMVNFGGNIVTIGSRPDGTPWRIGIQHPDSTRGDTVGMVEVVDRTVVTSGKYERFFIQEGLRYHHIVDTKTGYPVENGLASVTIVTDSSMKADALSTAVFALGLDDGLALIRGFDGVEAIIVTENNRIHLTAGIAESFRLVDTRFEVAQ